MRCAKVGSRMLCAFCQFGSCVSAVNSASPPSMRTRRSEPRTALSKRFSSHSSATRSAPETTTRGVPIMSSQKIGPCSRAMRIRSWIGAPPSTVSMLPSTGVRGRGRVGSSLWSALGVGGKSVGEVSKGEDVVMTSLPMPKDVEAVTLGDNGILANIGKGQTYIDLSTNAPSMVKKIGAAMAAKGIAILDAPVSGGTTGAEAATIAIMVGGDKKVFDDALPVLQSFSANGIHMGRLATGTVAKLVNNRLAFCSAAAAAEGL